MTTDLIINAVITLLLGLCLFISLKQLEKMLKERKNALESCIADTEKINKLNEKFEDFKKERLVTLKELKERANHIEEKAKQYQAHLKNNLQIIAKQDKKIKELQEKLKNVSPASSEKSTDFSFDTPDDLQKYVDKINNAPEELNPFKRLKKGLSCCPSVQTQQDMENALTAMSFISAAIMHFEKDHGKETVQSVLTEIAHAIKDYLAKKSQENKNTEENL